MPSLYIHGMSLQPIEICTDLVKDKENSHVIYFYTIQQKSPSLSNNTLTLAHQLLINNSRTSAKRQNYKSGR